MKNVHRLAAISALMAAALGFTGCATTSTPAAAVVVAPLKVAQQHPYAISLATSGGVDAASLKPGVSDPQFKSAIEAAIAESKVFKGVTTLDADYQLSVSVVTLDTPLFGGSMTATLEAGWTLVRTSDKQIVYRQVVTTAHTATMSDAFIGMVRSRLAIEGATRKNVEQALTAIGAIGDIKVASAK